MLKRKVVLGSMAFLAMIGIAAAEPVAKPAEISSKWELGPEVYYSEYKEPDFDVKIDGVMYGVVGALEGHNNSKHWMTRLEGRAAWGEKDYHSTASGSVNGIEDYLLEGRGVVGYDFHPSEHWTFTPFFGAGYRYLNDDSSGKVSSNGARGYERESAYFYSPAGAELRGDLNDGWTLAFNGEYEIFWSGEQKSHLEDALPSLNTISNDQDGGYGVRGSIKLQKKGEKYDILIEPFVRWWSVQDSQVSNITYTGVIVGYAYEPKNETLEAGCKVSLLF